MPELKTRPTQASVTAFIDAIADGQQRKDARRIAAMMRRVTGKRGRMWGTSIVGFGRYRYSNSAGRDFEWLLTGFSPRKQAMTVYLMSGCEDLVLLNELGPHKTGKSCLYIKRLADVDEAVLEALVRASVRTMRERYATD
ncbi:MAG TPA: DUF1801 domain-containing protein [Woeseiaceae bacterium]|nr:DUF1801 domain-containing protein [Woeseiaceae bacterium]